MRQLYWINQLSARITSGIIISDKSTRNKMFLEILGEQNGVCLKIFE